MGGNNQLDRALLGIPFACFASPIVSTCLTAPKTRGGVCATCQDAGKHVDVAHHQRSVLRLDSEDTPAAAAMLNGTAVAHVNGIDGVNGLDVAVGPLEPLATTPMASLEGQPGVVEFLVLNDKQHILTRNALGEVARWDVLTVRGLGWFFSPLRRTIDQAPEKRLPLLWLSHGRVGWTAGSARLSWMTSPSICSKCRSGYPTGSTWTSKQECVVASPRLTAIHFHG